MFKTLTMGLRAGAAAMAVCVLAAAAWAEQAAEVYRLGTGDRLQITVVDRPDLSGQFTVRPPGVLSMPLLGIVAVSGRTLADAEEVIAAKVVGGAPPTAIVQIDVVEYRPFFIVGAVKQPGRYPYVPGMTVLHAIAIAGGGVMVEPGNANFGMDAIRARQTLMTLSTTYDQALATRARLIAERNLSNEIKFPNELLRANSGTVDTLLKNEIALFELRRKSVEDEARILERQRSLFQEEIQALRGQIQAEEQQGELVEQELAQVRALRAKGLTPLARSLELERLAAEVDGRTTELSAFIVRAKQDIARVEREILSRRSEWFQEIVVELRQTDLEIANLEIEMAAARSILRAAGAVVPEQGLSPASQSANELVIVRTVEGRAQEIVADEGTAIAPGDILKVSPVGFELAVPLSADIVSAPDTSDASGFQ